MKIKLPRKVHMMGFKLRKHSPEILIAAGVAGVVTSTVMACRATLKINDILEEDKKDLETIHESADELIADEKMPYTEKDKRNDLVKCYGRIAVKVVKLYGPSVILGGLSIASILTSHRIIKKRNLALSSTLAMTEKAFREYRARVADEYGEDKERDIRYGVKEVEVEEEVTLKNGKTKKKKKKVRTLSEEFSPHSRFFDESSQYWQESADANLLFLKQTQNNMNQKLQRQGYLFLNDVYAALGLRQSKAGQIVGWIYDSNDPNRDCAITFYDDIWNVYDSTKRAFVNGDENIVLLDFNVDGNIIDDIFPTKTRKGMGLEV